MPVVRTASKLGLAIALGGLLACGSTPQTPAEPAGASAAVPPPPGPVVVPQVVPFYDANLIAGNIRRECTIDEQLSEFIASYARELGIDVERAPAVGPETRGTALDVRITQALSVGNAWTGHRKSTQIVGTLYRDGRRVAGFTGLRNSSGGFGGGFKGSCAVLGRTVRALGSDIANWLRAPVDGAHLGD